jgi:hypothetical protein
MTETLPDMRAIGKSIREDKAPIKSPVFTGTPQVPNVAAGDKTKKVANTSFVGTAVANLETSLQTAMKNLITKWGGTVPS